MMTCRQMVFLGVTVSLLVMAAYLIGSQRQANAVAQRLAEVEGRQQAFEAGVLNNVPRAQLASRLGYAAPPSVPDESERRPTTPEQAAQALQEKLVAMDQRFMAEPLDAKWAGETKASIEDSMVSAAVESGIQPSSFSADCRSRSCMIDMEVGSDTDMDRVIDVFTTEISGKLPVTTMVPITGPSGSLTLHILGTQEAVRASPGGQPRD